METYILLYIAVKLGLSGVKNITKTESEKKLLKNMSTGEPNKTKLK